MILRPNGPLMFGRTVRPQYHEVLNFLNGQPYAGHGHFAVSLRLSNLLIKLNSVSSAVLQDAVPNTPS